MLRLLLPLLIIPTLYQAVEMQIIAPPIRPMVSTYWFTYALFLIFGVFIASLLFRDVLIRLLPNRDAVLRHRIGIIVLLLSAVAVVITIRWAYSVFDAHLCNGLLLYKIAQLYPFFLLGYLLQSNPRVDAYVRSEWVIGMTFFVYALSFMAKCYGLAFHLHDLTIGLSGVLFIYGVVWRWTECEGSYPRVQSLLSSLGRISLPIYFVHYFFLPYLSFVHPHVNMLLAKPVKLFAFESIVGLLGTVVVLVPTIITIAITRSNAYLRFLLYGEPIGRKV